jgi:hypothetical protein
LIIVGLIEASCLDKCPGCSVVITDQQWAEHWLLHCPRFAEIRTELLPKQVAFVPLLGDIGREKGWSSPRGERGCIRAAKLCGAIMPKALELMWRKKTSKENDEDTDSGVESE